MTFMKLDGSFGDSHGPARTGTSDEYPPSSEAKRTLRHRAARVTGVLATMSSSTAGSEVEVVMSSGERIRGRLDPRLDAGPSQRLLDQRVVISGLARFRPSGQLLDVLVEDIQPASPADSIWATMPVPWRSSDAACADPSERMGVAAFFGAWPGEETDEELLASLEALG